MLFCHYSADLPLIRHGTRLYKRAKLIASTALVAVNISDLFLLPTSCETVFNFFLTFFRVDIILLGWVKR